MGFNGRKLIPRPASLIEACMYRFYFVQDKVVSIKIVGKFRYNCGMLKLNFQSKMLKLGKLLWEMAQIIAETVPMQFKSLY